ncbi:MAG TPA: Na+/H+ antiporter NhaC family protein [Bacteroidales bacterium]|nr:Na+/H+ antiporter NhaC family protein [Bacteroidales bacterium]
MAKRLALFFLIQVCWLYPGSAQALEPARDSSLQFPGNTRLEIILPPTIMQHVETIVEVEILPMHESFTDGKPVAIIVNGKPTDAEFSKGKLRFLYTFKSSETLWVEIQETKAMKPVRPIPLWMSMLPPLLAIAVALMFREVISALFIGLLTGTFIIWFFRDVGIIAAFFNGLLMIIDTYIPEAIMDRGHVSIIIFSMLIGAMVKLITDNGGMKGIVNKLSRFASTPRSGQFSTWLMGMAIFFDDYANTLVVGNTIKPITDRLKTSREKLAYIVDSTAAPMAAIAFVTTWIGAQLSYISDGIRTLELDETPYQVFIYSLQYAFYPFLTLAFVGMLIYQQRDFGPMFRAENKARSNGAIKPVQTEAENIETGKPRWFNAVIPVVIVVFGTIAGLVITGLEVVSWDAADGFSQNLSNIIGQADTYRALLWSSLAAALVAVLLTVGQKLLTLKESIESLIEGFKTMLTAILILVMAWAIALITQHLHTADFISHVLLNLKVSPYMIPAITFLFAAGVAFSTGSSWGTMAILYPLILPASWMICQANQMEYMESLAIFHNVVSCVLAGSVLGDHISPISDTTILSSLASGCNHIEHVRTQMPYALTVGVVAILLGTIPAAYGVPGYINYLVALLVLFGVISVFGKKLIATN